MYVDRGCREANRFVERTSWKMITTKEISLGGIFKGAELR
jgi:hypothetical protein